MRARSPRTPAIAHRALTIASLVILATSTLAPGPALGAEGGDLAVDWTMPDRYGADGDGDGLVDSFPPDGELEIEPDGWRVELEATGASCSVGAVVGWTIDGVEVSPSDPDVLDGDPTTCSFAYRFEDEGEFDVTVEAKDGDETVAEGAQLVRVRDFLIVSIGDSVASGEGNPDVPFVPTWQNQQCHRSALAGPARAARAIEDADERSSVTFVHLACSGATTLVGLLGTYEGQEPGQLLPPQVTELERLAGEREIDAVLVSIGANDVHFAKVVEACIRTTDCHLDKPGSAARKFAREVQGLPSNYERLAYALELRDIAPERVYLTEYFDPTRDDAGAYCDGTILGDLPVARRVGLVITAAEAGWASETMMPQLNAAGAAAATLYGWNRVGGIRDPFLTHGYCADAHWVVRYSESMPAQGNKDGSLHPNGPGHAVYGDQIAAALAENLLDEEEPPDDPEQIAFVSDRDGNKDIYAMNADGTAQTRLTNDPNYDGEPSLSPDGTKIAFTSSRDGGYDVYVMNVDGSGQTRLTNDPNYDGQPSFSPDGTKIAFVSNRVRGGGANIYVMNVDGSGQTRLTSNPGGDYNPSFSPDGTKIAFDRYEYPNGTDIYVMNADGSSQTRLTSDPSKDEQPSFSGDGTKIAFTSSRDNPQQVYVMNADGTGQTRLTSTLEGAGQPSFSGDGRKIAFSRNSDGNGEIYVMNADGTDQTRLTNDAASDTDPTFGP